MNMSMIHCGMLVLAVMTTLALDQVSWVVIFGFVTSRLGVTTN